MNDEFKIYNDEWLKLIRPSLEFQQLQDSLHEAFKPTPQMQQLIEIGQRLHREQEALYLRMEEELSILRHYLY